MDWADQFDPLRPISPILMLSNSDMKRMKRTAIFAIMASAMLVAMADRFYIEDFSVAPGNTVLVSLILNNDVPYTAFQADVYLPAELSLKSDSQYGFALTDRKGNHLLSAKRLSDGGIRLLSYSVGLDVYGGNDGALLTVPVTASEDFGDSVVIELKNVLFTTLEAMEVQFADETCTVTAVITLLGDVNNDGLLNIVDVTALIEYLLGIVVDPFNEVNADLDGNGALSIKDVTLLIDLLLRLK